MPCLQFALPIELSLPEAAVQRACCFAHAKFWERKARHVISMASFCTAST